MMLESLGIIGMTRKKKRNNAEDIQGCLSRIVPYLEEEDHLCLKLTCRAFYYWFVTSEIWVGLKLGVAEEKLQHYDDFQFEDVEPKQISKRDKNIRIHSLKKQSENKVVKREPSNIKQKSKAINTNNQLLFRNTEIGFKRLLKTNNAHRQSNLAIGNVLPEDIYAVGDPDDYLIKINDPWSLNMKKAQKLLAVVKKFNEFHHKFLVQLKAPCKEMHYLYVRLKEGEQKMRQYAARMNTEPLRSIIQSISGSNQNVIIQEQLSKVSKLFWGYHKPMMESVDELQPILSLCQEQKSKLQTIRKSTGEVEISSIAYLESVSSIEELVNNYGLHCQKYPVLAMNLCSIFITIYANTMESIEISNIVFEEGNIIQIKNISWKHLTYHPFFFQTLFQIINSLGSKLLKLASNFCSEDLTLAVTLTKVRNLKNVSQCVVNISKYFGKLRKQLQQKQKRSKNRSEIIRSFLIQYENRSQEILFQVKNPVKLEKWIVELKQKINELKQKMQAQ